MVTQLLILNEPLLTTGTSKVFAREVQKMKEEKIKPMEQLTLEPFERGQGSAASHLRLINADTVTQIIVL